MITSLARKRFVALESEVTKLGYTVAKINNGYLINGIRFKTLTKAVDWIERQQEQATKITQPKSEIEVITSNAPEVVTCAACPYFRSLEDGARGCCQLLDKVAKSYWKQTSDCVQMAEFEQERLVAREQQGAIASTPNDTTDPEVDYILKQEAKHERDFNNSQELETYSQQQNLQQRCPEAYDDDICFLCTGISLGPGVPRYAGGWMMPSRTQEGVRYKTTFESCTCPAAAHGQMCHHRQTLHDLICPVCGRKPGEPPFAFGDEVEVGGKKGKAVSDSPGVKEVGVVLEGEKFHKFYKYSEVRLVKKAPKVKIKPMTPGFLEKMNKMALRYQYGDALSMVAGTRGYR